MNLDFVFEALRSAKESICPNNWDAGLYLDLTLLDHSATVEQLHTLERLGMEYNTAALCIFPEHIPSLIRNTPQKLATVLNFPEGKDSLDQIFNTLDTVKDLHVQEIDYVFPWQDYLSGNTTKALKQCKQVVDRTHEAGFIIKVIMETGAFPDSSTLLNASLKVLETDCNFLKTSTGKIAQGATYETASILLTAIQQSQNPCGIKFSGGIKTREAAFTYLKLSELILQKQASTEWLRIGASLTGAMEIVKK